VIDQATVDQATVDQPAPADLAGCDGNAAPNCCLPFGAACTSPFECCVPWTCANGTCRLGP
jgi:hypothetical protein